ncbi:endonuclease/exonuclease/phosphatase family protein [bacterium]|nr:endonuclease/exonuclease/phosphatase family protein [bacterium]
MPNRWAAVLALCALVTGCARTRKPQSPTGPHISVLTFNVNYGGPRPDLAAKAILDADAGVVALQETTSSWQEYLTPRLRSRYPHIAFRHGPGAGGMAFLSKWPLVEKGYGRPEAGWFPGWIVEAQTPIGPVQFLNVHLRPAVSDKGSVGVGPYLSTKKVRLSEVQSLHRQLAKDTPTIVLGDFNEGDSGSAVEWLVGQGFIDALREFDRRAKTWRWRTRYVTLRGRLDHILYSTGIHCLSARVMGAGESDHLPVLAVFESPRTP